MARQLVWINDEGERSNSLNCGTKDKYWGFRNGCEWLVPDQWWASIEVLGQEVGE